jgi:hypothetical protein
MASNCYYSQLSFINTLAPIEAKSFTSNYCCLCAIHNVMHVKSFINIPNLLVNVNLQQDWSHTLQQHPWRVESRSLICRRYLLHHAFPSTWCLAHNVQIFSWAKNLNFAWTMVLTLIAFHWQAFSKLYICPHYSFYCLKQKGPQSTRIHEIPQIGHCYTKTSPILFPSTIDILHRLEKDNEWDAIT